MFQKPDFKSKTHCGKKIRHSLTLEEEEEEEEKEEEGIFTMTVCLFVRTTQSLINDGVGNART